MEWLDNLKEEIAWPYVQARNWLAIEDNQTGMWTTVIITAIVALLVYGTVFFGGRAAILALSEETMITVVNDNPCITVKGLVRGNAPSSCYEDKNPHPVIYPSRVELPMTRNNDASVTPSDSAYTPPCVKDGLPGCTDRIYGKRLLTGVIDTVTFYGDEAQTNDGHLQPDYTEISFVVSDQEDPKKEKFCGNVLDTYSPGRKLKIVLNESKQSDYNGCYITDVVRLTFGGDNYRPRRK